MNKEQIVKDILSTRRRVNVAKGRDIREIEIFEEQVEKSLKRIEQARYISKKFTEDELVNIQNAYESLRSVPKQ
ncbi:MAG: hypothetical protein RR448_01965 [Niameybacter sp.]|uniref:hypothetical protein n=1 Tax=Niameybacter sp. TaxID=2033640 RepID=UPI002FC809B6